MGRDKDLPLPPTTSPASLANKFNQFFINKIQTIKQKILSNNTEDINPHFMDTKMDKLMREFREMSSSEIQHIIMDSPGKVVKAIQFQLRFSRKSFPAL